MDINKLSKEEDNQDNVLQQAIKIFNQSDVYSVSEDIGGSVKDYQYFLYPFKGYSLVNTSIYRELAKCLAKFIPKDTEVILTIEADGIGLATLVAAELDLPLIICKQHHYNIPCVEFEQKTGYYSRKVYMPKLVEDKKVSIIDCMISTGATVKTMIDKVEELQGEVLGVYCLVNKNNYHDTEKENEFYKHPYGYIFDLVVENGKVTTTISSHLNNNKGIC